MSLSINSLVLMRSSFFSILLISIVVMGMTLPNGFAAVQGHVVFDVGQGWESAGVGFSDVTYNGSSFTMWYGGGNPSHRWNIGLATSNDGISWSRYPHNPVFRVAGAEQWDGRDVNSPSVIFEDGIYKMWYAGDGYSGTGPQGQIGYATSSDGINWTRYSGNPILSPGLGWDALSVSEPRVVHAGFTYLMYYFGQSPSKVWGIGLATSNDGLHWTDTGKVTIPGATQDMGSVEKVNGAYVGAYVGGGNATNYDSIGMASSLDGVSWTALSGNPIITSGTLGSGSWDSLGVFSPTLVVVGNNYYVYFSGNSGSNAQGYVIVRIGLAMLSAASMQVPEFSFTQLVLITSMGILLICFKVRARVSHSAMLC